MNVRTVVLLGDDDIRSQVRASLQGERNVDIVAEFCTLKPRHLGSIDEMNPDLVILDCSSRTINPLLAMSDLAKTTSRPQVVAVLAEGGLVDFKAIARLNPASFVNSPAGLRRAVLDAPVPASLQGVAA